MDVEDVLGALEVDPAVGLTNDRANQMLHKFGPNELAKEEPVPFWEKVKE